MKCEVCGEDAHFFSETYDPHKDKTRFIYLCERHQREFYDKMNDALAEIKAVKAIKEAMDDRPTPIIPVVITPAERQRKDIAKVLEWLYIGGVHIHGMDEEIEAAIRRIGGEE